MSDRAEESIGEMPTLGREETVRSTHSPAWNQVESIGELTTLGPGEIADKARKESMRAHQAPVWNPDESIGELTTLKPAGIVDDGRTDGARRWKAGEEILGRYVVKRELGQGGMGVVYGCFDKVGGVEVAVKCLPPELSHNSVEMEEVRENFQLVVGLRHSNIAGVRTLEKDANGEYYLVMDVAEGENLRAWLRRKWKAGGVSLEEAVGVLRQVASALDYAHGEKVVHRDVKPGNVMIDVRGRVKVLDYGLAAQIRTSLSRASHVYRGTSGTGPYMAPEQWEGQPQDGAADQYALGVMAYEMLAGRLPFENSELAVLKDAVLHGAVRDIPGVDKRAMGALRRALAKREEERWKSCGEFVEALAGEKAGENGQPGVRIKTLMGWVAALVLTAGVWFWEECGKGAGRGAGWENATEQASRPKGSPNGTGAEEAEKDFPEAEQASGKTADAEEQGSGESPSEKEERKAEEVRRAAEMGAKEAAEKSRQEKARAWVAREKVLEARNKADHMAALATEVYEARRQVAIMSTGGVLDKNHPDFRAAEGRFSDLTAQMQRWCSGEAATPTDAAIVGWETLATNAEEALRSGDAKVQAMLDGEFIGYNHPGMREAIAEISALQASRDTLGAGTESYRKGVRGLEEGERAFQDGGFNQAEEHWQTATVDFIRAVDCLWEHMASETECDPARTADVAAWFMKKAEQGDPRAQNELGMMYADGQGVEQSDTEAAKWFRKAAEQGHVMAQFNLGLLFLNGRGVAQNDTEAAKWFRKAAEQGNARAQVNLGWMYDKGRGVPQNSAEAANWYRQAADQGAAMACHNLGMMYQDGRGVPQNHAEAANWYRKAAERGYAAAQNELGRMYANGQGVEQDDAEAAKWLSQAAEQGNPDAQHNLGLLFLNGRGVVQSNTEAAKWFRKAAEQENANAQINLGMMYEAGRGVAQNDTEAAKWFRKAAEQGNASAQNNLGALYEGGRGVAQSYAEAVNWYRRSAEQGNANAQHNLGVMYENGRGVARNPMEAVTWYRKAAEQGNVLAQNNLGVMYVRGQGVEQNNTEAVKWFREAAVQGNALAQNTLGAMYENGLGVTRNTTEAVKWYRKAAEQGNALAKDSLQRLGK